MVVSISESLISASSRRSEAKLKVKNNLSIYISILSNPYNSNSHFTKHYYSFMCQVSVFSMHNAITTRKELHSFIDTLIDN